MAKQTIRSTFALDPETVGDLARLSERWGTSKSETLRRLIRAAALTEDVDASADAMAALGELQSSLDLSPAKTEAWLRRIREMRGHVGP